MQPASSCGMSGQNFPQECQTILAEVSFPRGQNSEEEAFNA